MIKNLLSNAGFKNVFIEPVNKAAVYTDVEDYIKGFLNGTPLNAFMLKKEVSV